MDGRDSASEGPGDDADTATGGGSPDPDVPSMMSKFLAVVSSIGPPVTVATALLVYFGWARSDAQARAMGLDVSLFGYTVQDYSLRSIKSMFFPLVCILLLGLLWLVADSWLRGQLPSGRRSVLVARMSTAAMVSGMVLAATCWVLAVVRPGGVFLVVPFLMAGGVLLAWWGARLRRLANVRTRPRATGRTALQHRALEATFTFTLVTALLFWGTSDFAQVVGRGQAGAIEAQLPNLPRADVYSHAELSIGAPGVTQLVLGTAEAPLYKYTGMHLLVASGGRFFLLPDTWTLARGTVVVLPDNDAVRVEFGKH
ncbi:MAG: hypothetical protein ABI563_09830 [Specibacter sp.]